MGAMAGRNAGDVCQIVVHSDGAEKLMEDQGMYSHEALASPSNDEITASCVMIGRPSSLFSGRTLNGGKTISILVVKNIKLAVFMFKTRECCSKPYDIYCVHSRSVLKYQFQWDLEQKKTDDQGDQSKQE